MYSTICQQYLNKIRGKNLKITIFKNLFSWEFPGSPGVRLHASNTGAWVLSLVRELRSHMLQSRAKKKVIVSLYTESSHQLQTHSSDKKRKKTKKERKEKKCLGGGGAGRICIFKYPL